jgi:hypothetical protein
MKKMFVDVSAFDENAYQLFRRLGLMGRNGEVFCGFVQNQPVLVYGIPKPDDNEAFCYPSVALVGARAYYLAEQFHHQEATALAEYERIIKAARNFKMKDRLTCMAVTAVHDHFVVQLASLTWMGIGSKEHIQERRGRIQLAKYNVSRIWQEGN